jgi:hypothetical protein
VGFSLGITRNNPLPIFNGNSRPYITSYDNWRAPVEGSFDPAKNRFLNAAAFPAQPNSRLGNATRLNPKLRAFPSLNENVCLGKTFNNNHHHQPGGTVPAGLPCGGVQRPQPGRLLHAHDEFQQQLIRMITSQANSPRQMQLGLKLYW